MLVAARLDRFARDAFVIGSIERQAQKAGGRVVTCDGATNDPLRRDLDVLITVIERWPQPPRAGSFQLPSAPGMFGYRPLSRPAPSDFERVTSTMVKPTTSIVKIR